MNKLVALIVLAIVSLARLASAATYTEALAAAKASDACYIEQSASGWTVVQECDENPVVSQTEAHLSASFSDAPCALAGEAALAFEVDGEEFDFESTYEWAFDHCEIATAFDCQ